MAKIKVQGLLGGSAKKISKAVGNTMSSKPTGGFGQIADMIKQAARNPAAMENAASQSMSKTRKIGRFEGAGARAGAAVDSGVAYAKNRVNRAKGYAMDVYGTAKYNANKAVNQVKESAGVAKAYVKKKERSAAYQVGKLVTGQTKNQNVNRRVGRISAGLGAGSAVGVGAVGAHIVNKSREGAPASSSMGNETSQNYNSSSWSAHKKAQRGY